MNYQWKSISNPFLRKNKLKYWELWVTVKWASKVCLDEDRIYLRRLASSGRKIPQTSRYGSSWIWIIRSE
jgi:hypothetical protein